MRCPGPEEGEEGQVWAVDQVRGALVRTWQVAAPPVARRRHRSRHRSVSGAPLPRQATRRSRRTHRPFSGPQSPWPHPQWPQVPPPLLVPHSSRTYCTAPPTHTLTHSLTQLHSRRHLHQPHLAALAARTAHHGTHPAQGGPRPQVAHTRSLLHTRSVSHTIILKISHGVSHSHWVNSSHYHLKPLTPVQSLTPYQLLTPIS